ncbi:MAG: N-acyl-D-amino-acid deacylase family protein [Actinomycetes bacterium]
MPHDIIIRNGTVVDGTGGPSVRADVAIDGDRIVAIGNLGAEAAEREIDARGMVVTPGFVDLHTHLDAQIAWDPMMTSSSWHGVTTVLMGNCGVTFAPVRPEDRTFLAEMMESVEDIPRDAILDGLPWDWETYPQYLDAVERMRPALNVVGMVGHCALRYHVMGERAISDEQATPEELARMREIAAESIEGGAVGFSTSRILIHTIPDGRQVPGTFADTAEYLAIADGMNDAGGGIFQAVPDFLGDRTMGEFGLLHAMAERAGDVLFSGGVGGSGVAGVEGMDGFLRTTNANVGRITSVAQTRPGGMLVGLAQVPPVAGAAWGRLMALPTLEERFAALCDPATRAELVEEGRRKGTWYDPAMIHPLGTAALPVYDVTAAGSLAELAAAAGVHPVEVVIDQLLETEGRALFNVWFFNRDGESLGEYLQLENVCPGLGDAGAHAGQICDADAPTHYLAYWGNERRRVSLEKAVRDLTAKPAAVLGLVDRGTLRVGAYADVNVFDPERIQTAYPEYSFDFPNGKGRLKVRSTGYAATIVNGAIVTEQGEHTGARPGRVIREFARA